jgi:hypothetical protein
MPGAPSKRFHGHAPSSLCGVVVRFGTRVQFLRTTPRRPSIVVPTDLIDLGLAYRIGSKQ